MPTKTYMVVDERRDHSFRIPRPDLSLRLGTPNACNDCHQDRSAEWGAAAAQKLWPELGSRRHFATALDAGRKRAANAADELQDLANDPGMPAIARATALEMLQQHPRRLSRATVETGLWDANPIVRLGASRAAEALDPATQIALLAPLLTDPVRSVRIGVARALAALPASLLDLKQSGALDFALDEYRHAQTINSDRPEAHLNLGLLHTFRGALGEAEREYRIALEQAPDYVATYVNLADLYRAQDRDEEGERLLHDGLSTAPGNADLNHALGLLLVRRGRLDEAIDYLARAAEARPAEVRYSYVLGVALESSGEVDRALAILGAAHRRHPAEPELLFALATFHRERGALPTALDYANRLLALDPNNPASRQLVGELESRVDGRNGPPSGVNHG